MRFDKVILLSAVALALGWGLGATKDPAKIGFVDAQQVLATVDSGKSAQEELERKAREAQARLAPMVEELEGMQKELQAKQFVMSKEAVQAKQLDVAELRSRIESQGQEEKNQLEIAQQRLLGPLQEKFLEVVREIGRDNNFSVVMLTDAPGLVYRREALDLTELVIKTFNGKS
jgi:Skp family chaperone for outer membrane proteins